MRNARHCAIALLIFTSAIPCALAADWRIYILPQFTLYSDLSQHDAEALIATTLWFARVAEHFVPVKAKRPPLRIIVFRRHRTFDRVVNQRHFAAYAAPGIAHTTLVVGPGRIDNPTRNLLHEYVHYQLRNQAFAYPLWYEEGLASLLSATQFRRDGEEVSATVGQTLPAKLANHRGLLPTLAEVTAIQSIDGWPLDRITGFYRRSAETVQYLLYCPDVDEAAKHAVGRYLAIREPSLFDAVGLAPEALTRAVRAHTRNPRRAFDTLSFDTQRERVDGRVLSETERLKLWAETAQDHNPRYAERLYKRLAALEPDVASHLARWALALAERDLDRAEEKLAQAQAIATEDPDVLLTRASLIVRRCPLDSTLACLDEWRGEVVASLRRVLAIDPDHFQAILMLGTTELYTGDPGAAVNYLRIAQARAPWSPRANYHLGECLRLLGNPRGRAHLEQTLAWARDPLLKLLATKSLELFDARS